MFRGKKNVQEGSLSALVFITQIVKYTWNAPIFLLQHLSKKIYIPWTVYIIIFRTFNSLLIIFSQLQLTNYKYKYLHKYEA